MTTGRIPDAAELADDLAEIKEVLKGIEDKLDAKYVPREVYEARHSALRSEIALELAAIKARADADRQTIDSARGLSQWALGLICSAVVIALVGFLVNLGGGVS